MAASYNRPVPELESSIASLLSIATIVLVVVLALAYALISRLRPLQVAALRAQLRGDAPLLWTRIRLAARETPPLDFALLAIFFAIGAWLRVRELNNPIGTDEAASWLYYASKPLIVGVTIWSSPNNHLLNTLLMHLSGAMFGPVEWALRLPAFVAGLALIPLAYATSRVFYRRGALIATGIVATSPVVVAYSTDGRGYAMLAAFALIAAMAMASLVRSGNSIAALIFAIAIALGFASVLVMITLFIFIVVWAFLERPSRWIAIVIACLLAGAFTMLAYYPVFVVSGPTSIATNGYHAPSTLHNFLHDLPLFSRAIVARLLVGFPRALQLLAALAFAAALIVHRRLSTFRYPIWLGFIAVVAFTFAERYVPPSRIWFGFLPFFFITIAAIAMHVQVERVVAIALVALLAHDITYGPHPRETGNLRTGPLIAAELQRRLQRGDEVVALTPSDVPLTFYLQRAGIPIDATRPKVDANRLYLVTNLDIGQTFVKTARELHVDVPRYRVQRVADFGASEIYELEKRR
jgi:hypothetical protein